MFLANSESGVSLAHLSSTDCISVSAQQPRGSWACLVREHKSVVFSSFTCFSLFALSCKISMCFGSHSSLEPSYMRKLFLYWICKYFLLAHLHPPNESMFWISNLERKKFFLDYASFWSSLFVSSVCAWSFYLMSCSFPSCNAQVAVSSHSCVQCHALFPFGHCDCVVLGGGLPFLVLDHNTVLVPLPCWLNIFCFLEWLFSMHSLNVSSLVIHSLVSFPTVWITSVVSSAFQVFAGLQKCLPNPIMFIDL